MAGEGQPATGWLTDLLDRWESLCQQDAAALIEQFVRQNCGQDRPSS
jgi:hypothetical protein